MPLIKGVCIPPVCVSVKFDRTVMVLGWWDTKKNAPHVPPAGQFPKTWNAALQQQAVNDHVGDSEVKCDGCVCWHPFPAAPWVPVPPIRADHPVLGNNRYRLDITGVRLQVTIGMCMPPGTQVKDANGKWVPLVPEPDEEKPKTPGSGGSSGGKKGKSMKKKGGTRTR